MKKNCIFYRSDIGFYYIIQYINLRKIIENISFFFIINIRVIWNKEKNMLGSQNNDHYY